jgi:hypothetical protein
LGDVAAADAAACCHHHPLPKMPEIAPVKQMAAAAAPRAGAMLRRYVRKLWKRRGGGFYGFVATLMFLYLEVVDIAGDILDLGGARPTIGWVVHFLVSNLVTIIINTIHAALWPITWIRQFGVGLTSAALIGGAYLAYVAVRPQVMRLLQEPGDAPAQGSAG